MSLSIFTLVINGAPGDGLHINQYFQMKGGNVSITVTGDGIDVGAKKTEKENNGQLIIEGGNLQITVSGDAAKGMKCERDMSILGGNITINTTGNAGMATAGSGDVLTGIVLALLAQGYSALDAATIAVYIHGSAGDAAATALSQTAMTSADIINYLPQVWLKLEKL